MCKINIHQLHDVCEVLCCTVNGQSYFIQDYDGFHLENDMGDVIYSFIEDEQILVTEEGNVIIDHNEYTPYTYKAVSKELLMPF